MRFHSTAVSVAIILFSINYPLQATTYYVDPASGSIGNDGAAGSPWNTLEAVAGSKTFSAGDTVLLMDGYHGAVTLGGTYTAPVVFAAAAGQTPQVKTLDINASGVIVDGLHISKSFDDEFGKGYMVTLDGYGSVLQNCTIFSIADNSTWYMGHWNVYTSNGVRITGVKNTVRNNRIYNVDFGIEAGYSADSVLVEFNTVDGFAGDGLRGLADYGTFQYNVVKNCYDVNANHDDGFQSWTYEGGVVGAGVVYGITLRGNVIINYEDPDQLYRGSLQGIGCFDGFFEGWRIENNIIFVDHWHGITLLGATDCVVINNTVGDLNTDTPGPPWIQLGDHKDGRTSTGLIRNNLCTRISGNSAAVRQDHNVVSADYDLFYVDYAGRDFHLKEGCAAIDAGTDSLAPAVDAWMNARLLGGGVDAGAFEFGNTGIRPGVPVINASPAPEAVYCRPNPATDGTMISVPATGPVSIYDASGALVKVLDAAVNRQVYWDTRGFERGMYLVESVNGHSLQTGKILLQ